MEGELIREMTDMDEPYITECIIPKTIINLSEKTDVDTTHDLTSQRGNPRNDGEDTDDI